MHRIAATPITLRDTGMLQNKFRNQQRCRFRILPQFCLCTEQRCLHNLQAHIDNTTERANPSLTVRTVSGLAGGLFNLITTCASRHP